MDRNIKKIFLILFVVVFLFAAEKEIRSYAQTSGNIPTNATREELEQLIRTRAEELEKINRQLESTQQNLSQTKTERSTLQQEVQRLTRNISDLELRIKSDQLTTQKLGLEIENISYDIKDIEQSIVDKRAAVTKTMRELQSRDNLSPLLAFLKSSSLTEGVFEAHALQNLREQIQNEINSLTSLQDQLSGKLKVAGEKKGEIEVRQKNLSARKEVIEDQQEERRIVLTQTKNKESLYEQQLAELKKQQDGIQDEIAKYENQLKANFDSGVLPSAQRGLFEWPIQLANQGGSGRISQHYGEKSSLYRGKPHNGLDIAAPVGTPVVAVDEGTVMAVDDNDRSRWSKYQYGKYILIKHPNNLATLYAHLSQYSVRTGQKISRGELIGYSGNTGYSTGPHLHLMAYWAPTIELKKVPPAAGLVPIGVHVDPENYLAR